MMKLLRRLRCRLFGHRRNMEDLGGVIYEVCDRCPWVGRHSEYPVQVVTFSVEFGKAVATMHPELCKPKGPAPGEERP